VLLLLFSTNPRLVQVSRRTFWEIIEGEEVRSGKGVQVVFKFVQIRDGRGGGAGSYAKRAEGMIWNCLRLWWMWEIEWWSGAGNGVVEWWGVGVSGFLISDFRRVQGIWPIGGYGCGI